MTYGSHAVPEVYKDNSDLLPCLIFTATLWGRCLHHFHVTSDSVYLFKALCWAFHIALLIFTRTIRSRYYPPISREVKQPNSKASKKFGAVTWGHTGTTWGHWDPRLGVLTWDLFCLPPLREGQGGNVLEVALEDTGLGLNGKPTMWFELFYLSGLQMIQSTSDGSCVKYLAQVSEKILVPFSLCTKFSSLRKNRCRGTINQREGLLDHTVILFLVFLGIPIVFSTVAAPIYTSTNSV